MSSCKKVDIMLSPSSKQIHKPVTNQVLFMALSAPRAEREKKSGDKLVSPNLFLLRTNSRHGVVSGIVPNLGFRSIPAGDNLVPSISLSKTDNNRKGDLHIWKIHFLL
jgi:hypothetical protein